MEVHYTKKVKDISQYLDLNTKIKAISRNSTKNLENFKISLTFLCSVYYVCVCHISVPYLNVFIYLLYFSSPTSMFL